MKRFYHLRQEVVCDCAVQNSMVESQAQINHRPDCDGVIWSVLNHDHPLLNGANTQDGALRLVDDGSSKQRARGAVVRDGECPAAHFIRLQFMGAGPGGKIIDRAGQP